MRNRARHSWLATVLIASCPNQAIGQGDLGVSVVATTATQAMLSYTAPTDAACIVEASDSAEYWQPLHDLDLPIIEGADSGDGGGRKRTILIGTPSTEVGRGNTAYSLALQPDTLYYFRLTCGQAVATGTFRTAPLTNGITYSDASLPSQPGPGIPVITDSISPRPPPVPSPWRPPWRPRRHLGNSCVSNGRGGGAWNSPATWTGCDAGVPGNGDTATLSNGDTVTVPAGYHAIVGASGAAGNQHSAGGSVPALQCSAQNGNAILVVDGTLTFRGNVEQCTAVWQVGPDAILEHDSSQSSSGSTTHFRWIIGVAANPTIAVLRIRGTIGHRVTVRNATGSGTFYGFTYSASGAAGSGQFDFEYVNITGCGGPTPCTYTMSLNSSTASIGRCDHCNVSSSGYMGAGYGSGPANVVTFTNSTFTTTTDPTHYALRVVVGGTEAVTLDTLYVRSGSIVLGGGSAPGTHVRNIVMITDTHIYGMDLGGAHFRVAEFDLVARITPEVSGGSTGAYSYIPGGNLTRLMCLINSNSNPHCFSGPHGDGVSNDVVDGGYFEKLGTGTDGDTLLGTSGSIATLTTIKNTVMACSTTDGFGMSLSSNALGSPYWHTYSLQNNTYCGKDDQPLTGGVGDSRGFGFELAYAAPTGMLASARNNLVYCATNVPCYLVHRGPTGTNSTGTYQDVDYNWKWNVSAGPYLDYGTDAYSPNPPGAHDSSGDPQFVEQRHFLEWGRTLKPSIASWSDIVAEFAKMNDDTGYDSRFTLANAYNWLRDGYRPQNAAVMTAGDTGGRVGAMDSGPQQ